MLTRYCGCHTNHYYGGAGCRATNPFLCVSSIPDTRAKQTLKSMHAVAAAAGAALHVRSLQVVQQATALLFACMRASGAAPRPHATRTAVARHCRYCRCIHAVVAAFMQRWLHSCSGGRRRHAWRAGEGGGGCPAVAACMHAWLVCCLGCACAGCMLQRADDAECGVLGRGCM